MRLERVETNWLERGLMNRMRQALFALLLFIYYYAVCGKLNVSVKYAVNVLIFGWAAVEFLLSPNVPKAKVMLEFMAVFLIPFLLLWLYSLGIWILELKTSAYMIRGSQNIIYMVTNMMMMAASYYLMEEDCIDFHAWTAIAANGLCFLLVARTYGMGTLLSQYFRQIITFAGESGDAIQKMEFHDMTYGFGALCVYFGLHKKKGHYQWIVMIACWLSYFCAMKKIGMFAAAAAIAFGIVYRYLSERGKKRIVAFCTAAIILGSFFYVWYIKSGLFRQAVQTSGIDTSGRVGIYYIYDDAYTFSPMYFGHGIRYIYSRATQQGTWSTLHNVYLELFIEVGFWVLLVFEGYEGYIRQKSLSRTCSWKYLMVLAASTLYIFITYFTDNTSFQPPINTLYRLTGMVAAIEGMALRGGAPWKRVVEPEEPPDKIMQFLMRHRMRKAERRRALSKER